MGKAEERMTSRSGAGGGMGAGLRDGVRKVREAEEGMPPGSGGGGGMGAGLRGGGGQVRETAAPASADRGKLLAITSGGGVASPKYVTLSSSVAKIVCPKPNGISISSHSSSVQR